MKTLEEQKEQHSDHRITLRIPMDLYVRINNFAKANSMTLTGEILSRLEVSTLRDDLAAQAREIAELKRMVRELLEK